MFFFPNKIVKIDYNRHKSGKPHQQTGLNHHQTIYDEFPNYAVTTIHHPPASSGLNIYINQCFHTTASPTILNKAVQISITQTKLLIENIHNVCRCIHKLRHVPICLRGRRKIYYVWRILHRVDTTVMPTI